MMNSCIFKSQYYSPIAQLEYDAKICRGARCKVVATIMMQYSKAPPLEEILINCAMVE